MQNCQRLELFKQNLPDDNSFDFVLKSEHFFRLMMQPNVHLAKSGFTMSRRMDLFTFWAIDRMTSHGVDGLYFCLYRNLELIRNEA